ncbi:hypothetical protein ACI51W_03530 [Pseudomonas marginalis]|uniref:hypothetical protein n=1 Tax=Pseudomonas marginalis TaxID=298 RepID=UPI00386BF3E9
MIKVKISALLLSILLIAGCSDEGDRIPGKCGVSESNENKVAGFNFELCAENKSAIMTTSNMKGAGKQAIPKGDEAYEAVQAKIDADPASKLLQEEANLTTAAGRFAYNSIIYLMGICILIWNYVRILISKAAQEHDLHEEGVSRYGLMALFMPMLGVFMLCPWFWGDLGEDENSTVAERVFTTVTMWSDVVEAGGISSLIAWQQQGDIGAVESEAARKYDPSYANARSIAFAMVNAALLDNRTAKFHYKYKNFELPVEKRNVEFQEPLQFYFTDNSISIKRLPDGSLIESDAIAVPGQIEITTVLPLNNSVKNAARELKSQYLTSSPANFEPTLKEFKAAIMAKIGVTESNPDINNAVTSQANELVQQSLMQEIKSNSIIKKIARLNEETQCTINRMGLDEEYLKDIKNYLKFLTGVEAKARFEGAIECIGGKNGAFMVYGERTLDVVTAERNAAFKELVDDIYSIITAHATALANVTIDKSNGNYCVLARKGQTTDFALYYPLCIRQSEANRQIINMAASSYTMSGNGEGSYVDTNYALKGNHMLDTLVIDNFDTIMSDMFNSVEVKVDFYKTDKNAYLENLIRGNLGDSDNLLKNILEITLKPTATLKRDLGMTDECDDFFYCVKPANVIPALNNIADKLIDSGVYVAFFSITASQISSKFTKGEDKSANLENQSKKNKSGLQKALTVVTAIFSMFATLGWIELYAGGFIKYVLAVPQLFFVVASLMIILMMIFNLILAPFRFLWLLWPNDNDNFVSNGKKLINEFLFNVTAKLILVMIQAFFYPILGFALLGVSFLMMQLADQGVKEAIFSTIMLGPMLYLTVVGILKATIVLLDKYIERLEGNAFMAGVLQETLDLCFIVITFCIPLLFVRLGKTKGMNE